MKGSEFIRKIRRLGHRKGINVEWVARRGKGRHGTLVYGSRFTIVRNLKDELKTGTLHAMLDQLGLTLEDLYESE
jgi:mRNA interferase HicA